MSEPRRDPDAPGTEPTAEGRPSDFVETFTTSMPGSYRLQYGEPAIRDHAAIAWRRGAKLVHIEPWRDADSNCACLCVVTDDRAGLLALLTAAISAHGLDILTAKVFGRSRRWQEDEAVDFFWVRGQPGHEVAAIDGHQIAAIADTIALLLCGELDLWPLAPRTDAGAKRLVAPSADVRFEDEPTERLVVEADDRPGLLSAITRALASAAALIVWSSVSTKSGRAHDEFRVRRHDGQRLSREEKDALVRVVIASLASMS